MYGKSLRKILYVLLSTWVFAIVAPPVVAYLSNDGKSVITWTLTEEEQHSQGKKSLEEKQLLDKGMNVFLGLSQLQDSISYDFYVLGNSDSSVEVALPPPKNLI